MDGENTTLYHDGLHARSLNTIGGVERDYVKGLWGRISHEIPPGFRICGENLEMKHSIHYQHLADLFLAFSVWEGAQCLSWADTVDFCEMLGVSMVPTIKVGLWDEPWVWGLHTHTCTHTHESSCEGYVVRPTQSFSLEEFPYVVGKWVRPNHVTTDTHWKNEQFIKNRKKV